MNFNSGAFFDGRSCDNLRTGCQASTQTASVGGRVTDSNGRGIANARVTLTGDHLTAPRYALTNPFGYYRFADVAIYFSYQATVFAKNRSFTQPSVALTVTEVPTNLNFTSNQ
jgi:hypothetical protein